MRNILNKEKLRKFIYNALFYGVFVSIFILFVGTLLVIWSKFEYSVENKYVSSQIMEMFDNLFYLNIIICVIGFLANMFIFNGEIKKIIKKDKYSKIATLEFIIFGMAILLLVVSPILYKMSNLSLSNYKMKTIYCMSYCSTFMSAFVLFYLFSFFCLIAEDDSYNKAKPYIYRIDNLGYDDICKLIVKQIGKIDLKGEFFNSDYKVNYYILHKNEEFVYCIINLKNISDEFLKLYCENQLIDFVEYLYKNKLNKKRYTKIMYFICVDTYDDNFKNLIESSAYQDEHFCILHTLINLKGKDLYIGGIRDGEKQNIKKYILVKEEIERILVDVLKKN